MRTQRARRFATVVAVAAAATLAFAGCSGAGSPNEHVTLTYGLWDQTQVPAMKDIVTEFEKENPDIDVKIAVTPWDTYWTKLKTAATGGAAPDVFWMMMDRLKLYAHGDVLMPLSDRIKDAGMTMDHYYPATAKGFTYSGTVYGLPKDTNSFGVFYNKDLFAKAGVLAPDASWTWDDLAAAAKKLTNPAAGVYGIAAPCADVLGYYLTIPQAGGDVIDASGKKSGYDQPETIDGLRFWTDLINKDHSSPSLQQLTDTDALTMFTSGKVAMYYGGSWDPLAIKAVPASLATTGIAPLPRDKNSSFYSNGVGNVISAKSKHPEQAWKFLQFLGSRRSAEIQAKTGTVIPAYQGLEKEYAASIPQLDLTVLTDQLPNAQPIPSSLDTAVWSDAAIKEFAKAWGGQETIDVAARNAADQMNAALRKEASS